jgi:hypothetical protein
VHQNASVAHAVRDGHRLAVEVTALAIGSVGLAGGLIAAERAVRPNPRLSRMVGRSLAALPVIGILAVLLAFGTPAKLVHGLYKQFRAPTASGANLNQRLFSFTSSNRLALWDIALEDFAAHPVLGSGAGTYEDYWNQRRPNPGSARDAHSLYLETMAELGIVGLALLLAVLALPLTVIRRARGHPLLAIAAGGYVAYLVHAAVDWDWELPAVTIAGLICAVAILAMAHRAGHQGPVGRRRPSGLTARSFAGLLALLVIISVVSVVDLVGHRAAAASAQAAANSHWGLAERDARVAAQWEPWSPEPWKLLADAKYGEDDLAAAAHDYRMAIQRDPRSWELWFDLGFSLDGADAEAAFAHARALNPRNPEIPGP